MARTNRRTPPRMDPEFARLIKTPAETTREKSLRIANSRLNNAIHSVHLMKYLVDRTFDLHPTELIKLLDRVKFEVEELEKVYRAGSRQNAALVELR